MKFENLPPRLQVLPTDHRGYPVPWFVAKIDGEYDFRVVDPEKFAAAIRLHRCWVCGQGLGRWLAFPIGPMCALTRTVSEPPSHRECAEWSIRHCPFLANPSFVRDHGNVPQGVDQPAGLALMRNPGVVAHDGAVAFEHMNRQYDQTLCTACVNFDRLIRSKAGRARLLEQVQEADIS